MTQTGITATAVAILLTCVITGCGDSADEGTSYSDAPKAPANPAAAAHDHPSEGPHHGALIELGNEEYHAEFIHDDDAGTVTIYILDSGAKETVPIDAKEITINLTHDGQGEQFKLAASPDAGDPEGRSSRFVSDEQELGEDLDAEHAEARVVMMINGQSYTGAIPHDHDEHDKATE